MTAADTLYEGLPRNSSLICRAAHTLIRLNYMSELISYHTENNLNFKVQQVTEILLLNQVVLILNTAL
jgi:hypothetical protein